MGIMDGVKVVELGVWVAGPAVTGVLADWGADVIKVEGLDADPFRGALAEVADFSAAFELDNRGKRALAIDWRSDEGAAIVGRLADAADVFVTNLRPGGLALAGLDYETLRARNPRLIYASVTGYGLHSSEADRPAFDVGAFWSRPGIANLLGNPGGAPGGIRPGLGDHTTAMQALAGVSAALYHRERSGEGQQVRISLLRGGAYTIGWDIGTALTGAEVIPRGRDQHPNLLIAPFRTRDGGYMHLLMMQGDRFWAAVLPRRRASRVGARPRASRRSSIGRGTPWRWTRRSARCWRRRRATNGPPSSTARASGGPRSRRWRR